MTEVRQGRPRSESSRRAILEATRDLVLENGFAKLTVEGIASRSGTGKQTIYRWWPSKSVIVADAVLEGYLSLPLVALPETDSLEADLKSWVTSVSESLRDPVSASIVRALTTAASDSEEEGAALYSQMTGPFYSTLIVRLERGRAAGQLSASVEAEAVVEALLGAVLFRTLSRRPSSVTLIAVVDALLPKGTTP